ncbi:MAG: carboxypeptidase-like regulatory domain-containing protein [Ignavibacteriales bacterium]|nr:carboxypeptidase-like regulatory domain-containing protein [Ignavibacteriales bacterium]
MKLLIILLFVFWMNPFAQVITIRGKILDSATELPLENANITIKDNAGFGVVSDSEGMFSLSGNIKYDDIIEISFVGYEKLSLIASSLLKLPDINIINLTPAIISSQSILVEAFRRKEEAAPISYSYIDREEIKENYTLPGYSRIFKFNALNYFLF